MFGQSNQDHYRNAIQAAQQERDQLIAKLSDLEKLQQRLSELEIFIEKGRILLGLETVGTSPLEASALPSRPRQRLPLDDYAASDKERPSYLKAADILREIGRPMKLSEIAGEFHRRGWRLSAKNGTEVLRHSLGKRPNLFKNYHGLFSLKEEAVKNKSPEPELGETGTGLS